MLDLKVYRSPTKNEVTEGGLMLGDFLLMYTLEDAIREVPGMPVESWKIKGQTATPAGRYQVVPRWSNHFQCLMPHITNVPGYTDVLIHVGNKITDTEGCLLVGNLDLEGAIGNSKAAFDALHSLLKLVWARNEEVWIEFINP